MLKGQLNYLISVQGMLCSKSYMWELESIARSAYSVCLVLGMGAQPHHSDCGGHMPTQPLVSHGYRPDTVLCSGKCRDKLPLLRIPISQKNGTTIPWGLTMGWALGIQWPILSFNLSEATRQVLHIRIFLMRKPPQTTGTNLTLKLVLFSRNQAASKQ